MLMVRWIQPALIQPRFFRRVGPSLRMEAVHPGGRTPHKQTTEILFTKIIFGVIFYASFRGGVCVTNVIPIVFMFARIDDRNRTCCQPLCPGNNDPAANSWAPRKLDPTTKRYVAQR